MIQRDHIPPPPAVQDFGFLSLALSRSQKKKKLVGGISKYSCTWHRRPCVLEGLKIGRRCQQGAVAMIPGMPLLCPHENVPLCLPIASCRSGTALFRRKQETTPVCETVEQNESESYKNRQLNLTFFQKSCPMFFKCFVLLWYFRVVS